MFCILAPSRLILSSPAKIAPDRRCGGRVLEGFLHVWEMQTRVEARPDHSAKAVVVHRQEFVPKLHHLPSSPSSATNTKYPTAGATDT